MIDVYQLSLFIDKARNYASLGKVADYIPALGKSDPNLLSAAIFTKDGKVITAGDDSNAFTLQSVVKVLSLAVVIMDHGPDFVFERVGMEPTGNPFNSISKLEHNPFKPLNPMVNGGALVVTDMVLGVTVDEKLERIITLIRNMADNTSIGYNEEVANSEFHTANLNRSLCYFMKEHGEITGEVEELIDLYTKMCAIEVNCRDLARIGAVIANNGKDPVTFHEIIPSKIVHIMKSFMVTCGMYNASGEFAMKVGVPAKSGVSGALMGAIPQGGGIGIYGPALDAKGNSAAGVKLMEFLSAQYNFSIFLE